MANIESGRIHALLIGIDNYENRPLAGCVNDIDQVQSFLSGKLAVPPESISRLDAPLDSRNQSPRTDDRLPSYDNIAAALRQLDSDKVQRGDRVFIYYSGHGGYEKIPLAEAYFEGLVPLDFEEKGLLFDVELNQFLQNIADRSGDLTVILDCCHSAGATRDVAQEDSTTRFMPLERATTQTAPGTERLKLLGATSATRQAPQEYTVIAACHADELATECRVPPKVGKTHGLLTHYLFDILSRVEPQALDKLRWSDIWEKLKAAVIKANASQIPMLLGPKERRIFGGPWQPQDTGYAISQNSDGSYEIAAGSLAGLGNGTQIAVYGAEPALFPLLNSDTDKQARHGVLIVNSVQPAQASASPMPKGAPPFALPAAARGRLIKQGAPDHLRVAISQNLDPEVRRFLDENVQWDRFVLLPENDPNAECRVGQYADGDIWIGDDLNGPGAPIDTTAPGPIGRVSRIEAEDAEGLAVGLRGGLNHYAQYVIPLRVYRNGGFTLPEKSVEVKLLDCTKLDTLQMERDASIRREAKRDEKSRRYVIGSGTPVAFHLYNNLSRDLYVFLLLCNLEGQIQPVECDDVVLTALSGKIFWFRNSIGSPFTLFSPQGRPWGIDRLIVIAADQKDMDLRPLIQARTMNQAITQAIATRSLSRNAQNSATLCWTAVQTLIQIGGPAGPIS